MSHKIRIDQLLVTKGFIDSRERAKTTIMSGLVFVNNQRVDKPGTMVNEDSEILVKGDPIGFVSRGGLKLNKAISSFQLELNGLTAIDAGASTGGFTDCMLQNGVKKVYAIDVGYGQLAWKLRTDERVVCMERTNIRYVTHNEVPEEIDFITADLSFISLKLVLPVFKTLLKKSGKCVCLIKPQFEAGREKVGKKGVVSDPETHKEVINNFILYANKEGFSVLNLTFSPVKGPEGNIEYLGYLQSDDNVQNNEISVDDVVYNAHQTLDKEKKL